MPGTGGVACSETLRSNMKEEVGLQIRVGREGFIVVSS
jgi:hypothetical protein